MLDEHLIHVAIGKIGVQRRAAQRHKSGEGFFELPVLLVRFVDVLAERLRQVRNPALELIHGALELTLVAFIVREEAVHELRDFDGFVEREFAGFAAVLIKHGSLRILKNSVAGGISGLELLLDFRGQVVRCIFRFPPAARQFELVAHSAIGHHPLASGIGGKLRHQRPAALFRRLIQQVLERPLKPQLVRDGLALQVCQVLEVSLNQRIAWNKFEHRFISIVTGLFAGSARS